MSRKSMSLALLMLVILSCKERQSSLTKIIDGDELADYQFATTGEILVDSTRRILGTEERFPVKDGTVCTGTLLCDDVVLTAAHCTTNFDEKRQSFVDYDAKYFFKTDRMSQKIPIDWYMPSGNVVHPKFITADRHADYGYDVALIKLKTPVVDFADFNRFPLAFERLNNNDAAISKNNLTAIGYSSTEGRTVMAGPHIRRMGLMSFMNYSKRKGFDDFTSSEMLSVATPKQKICFGDSGGPLYIRRHQRYEQVGIVSTLDKEATSAYERMTGNKTNAQADRICTYIENTRFVSVPDVAPWVIEQASKMCSRPNQLIRRPANAETIEVAQKLDVASSRHLIFYRDGATDNIPVKCTFSGGDYYLSDFFVAMKTGSFELKLSTYDPKNYLKPWATTATPYKLSKYYSNADFEWLIGARPPTSLELTKFMNEVLMPQTKIQGHFSWRFSTCKAMAK